MSYPSSIFTNVMSVIHFVSMSCPSSILYQCHVHHPFFTIVMSVIHFVPMSCPSSIFTYVMSVIHFVPMSCPSSILYQCHVRHPFCTNVISIIHFYQFHVRHPFLPMSCPSSILYQTCPSSIFTNVMSVIHFYQCHVRHPFLPLSCLSSREVADRPDRTGTEASRSWSTAARCTLGRASESGRRSSPRSSTSVSWWRVSDNEGEQGCVPVPQTWICRMTLSWTHEMVPPYRSLSQPSQSIL